MAESYSVKAVLSAEDRGFSSAFKNASGSMASLGASIKSGLGFGILTGAGQQAFSAISNGVTGIVSELSSSSAAWKTFEGNMQMFGKSSGEIKSTKKELQDFATQTIYSASDMATTFAQLEAVGTKNTTKLVKGFGGLAAAAENPTQAMKTLSVQATQMAAKPMVAWQDFKLILEQTPAGIAAIAKEMGMTATELVASVQDGTIATQDFFDAIATVGTNDAFTKLATEYKTVDQAMDGLKETLGTKLGPAFEVLSSKAISGISGIVDELGNLDGDSIASKVTSAVDAISPYLEAIKTEAGEVWNAFGEAFSSISKEVQNLTGSFGGTDSVENFSDVIGVAGDALKTFAGFLKEHSETIAQVITHLPQILAAYAGFKILKTVTPLAKGFTSAIRGLASKGMEGLSSKLFGISKGQEAVGKSSGVSSSKMLTSAKSFMMLGAGILMVSGGFALLAYSAVSLANAGPLAIGVMVGLVAALGLLGGGMVFMLNAIQPGPAKLKAISVSMLAMGAAVILVAAGFALLTFSAISLANAGPLAIGVMVGLVAAFALLAVGAAILGPALTAGAVGFIAFGAAIVLVGVGALLAATALMLVAGILPTVVQYGASGAIAIAQLSLGMIAFAAGAALAGVGCVVLGAGLAIVAVGLVLVGVAVLVTAAGVLMLATGALVLGAGLTLTAAALMLTAAALPIVAVGALLCMAAFTAMLAISAALVITLMLLNAPLLLLGASSLIASAGILAFGVSMAAGCVGVVAMGVALKVVNSSMKSIASNSKIASSSIKSMVSSIDIVNTGLDALGSKANSAVNKMISVFSGGAGKANTSAIALMTGFNSGMQTGGVAAIALSVDISQSIISTFMAASGGAYNCGYYIGIGLANGMRSSLNEVRAVATELAGEAEKAVRAKAKIKSPSRVFRVLGAYIGEGLAIGIDSMKSQVEHSSQELVAIPNVKTFSDFSAEHYMRAGNQELSNEYSYRPIIQVNAEVTSVMDGKAVGYGSAKYVDEKNQKAAKLKSQMMGVK